MDSGEQKEGCLENRTMGREAAPLHPTDGLRVPQSSRLAAPEGSWGHGDQEDIGLVI